MSYKVHNVRWVGLEGRPGGCMAYSRSRKLLALSRADNSIEIWNFSSRNSVPVLERCIPAQATEGSVEALAFAGPVAKEAQDNSSSDSDSDTAEAVKHRAQVKKKKKAKNKSRGGDSECADTRLFSTGLHGLVIEHDLDHVDSTTDDRHQRQRVWAVTSGPAWCMKFNKASGQLAVGTEEGYVCLYNVVEDGLDFAKVLDKQEGRIFCLDWHTSGTRIVTGSADTLRVWDVSSGLPLCRMSTGRTEKHRETVVWSVALLDDMTVVSGDSRGKTSFWNGRTGTLTDGYQTHRADVLAVAVNEAQTEVFSSGVDPVVFHFSPVATGSVKLHSHQNKTKGRKWVKSVHRFSHTHDVRAILCIGSKVVSVGVDSNLTVFDTPSKTLVKYPPIPHGRHIVLSPTRRLMTVRQNDTLDVWELGDSSRTSSSSAPAAGHLPVVQDPVKCLTMKMTAPISSFDVSSDGDRLVCVTTEGKIKMFAMQLDGKEPSVQKIPFAPTFTYLSRFNHVRLLGNCKQLLASTVGGTLVCFDVESGDTAWSFNSTELKLRSGIRAVEVHKKLCLVTDFSNNLRLVDTSATDSSDLSDKCLQELPANNASPVAAAAFDPHDSTVVVVYANHHFMEYCPKLRSVTKFSKLAAGQRTCPLPAPYLSRKFPTTGCLFPQKGTVMFYDVENVCSLDKARVLDAAAQAAAANLPPTPKAQKGTDNSRHVSASEVVAEPMMRVTKKYQNLLFLGSLGDTSELVAVEDKPQSLEARLPAGIRQKKFGAM